MADELINVIVEKDLEPLIPGFLQRRREDVEKLKQAMETMDMETLRVIGHSMKGTGGGYGFDGLSEIGAAIESAAKAGEQTVVSEQVEALVDYLNRLQVNVE